MSISNAQAKLDYIAETKTAIKDALEAKGVIVGSETFRNYATKVAEIAGAQVVHEFTSSGTYTKPAGLFAAVVVCIGAGGGGGAGRRGVAGTRRRAGSGGGAGNIVRRMLMASEIAATESIAVGAGGVGGTIEADSTDGSTGSAGGDTSFGTLVLSKAGAGGGGGGEATGGATYAHDVTLNTPGQEYFRFTYSNHNSGAQAGFTESRGLQSSQQALRQRDGSGERIGGASGGGLDVANTQRDGGLGGRMYNAENTQSAEVAAGTEGGGNGNNGVANWGNQILGFFGGDIVTTKGYGTSGSGGGSANAANSGNGGNGGNYGGGGGGGAASTNGYSGGNGGNGGDGLCVVMEIYI